MRVLITGASGFVGQHLARHLIEHQERVELHGTTLTAQPEAPGITYHSIDLVDEGAAFDLIQTLQPDHVYHLAGQAFVPRSFEDPWETLETNIRAQLNLLQACLKLQIAPRFLVVGSAEVYGAAAVMPITEETPLRPSSPYSVSKIAQDMLGLQYHLSHQLPVMRVRPFNHFGPGQNARFVAPAFAMQIASIEAGLQEPRIHVGDLSNKRDFTDVRDIVRAYHMVVEQGLPGEVYNVATGEARSIQALLDVLLSFTDTEIEVVVDQSRFRPGSIPVLTGDATRLYECTGWKPQISFETTLHDVLEDCRQRVRQAQ